MIYALKLLFAVLLVSGVAMTVYRNAFAGLVSQQQYRRAWMLVIACMVASYLCKFPALFFLVLGGLGLYGSALMGATPVAALCAYLLLSIVCPPISLDIGGVGGINSILRLDGFRLLAIVVLLVPALRLLSAKKSPTHGGLVAMDVAVLLYPALRILMALPYSTATTTARSIVETFLDVWLPYYVATRAIRSAADLRLVVVHVAIALLFGASVGVTEELIQHNLFTGLEGVYGIAWQLSYVLMRGSFIRVQAMTQQPIILAFAMLFGLGMWVWLRGLEWRKPRFFVPFAALLAALIFTWSRGPWLGAILLFGMFALLRRLSGSSVRILLILGVIAAVILKAVGADEAIAGGLAALFGGSESDVSTIEYRRELLDTSLALIKQSPWLGVPNYAAQMQSLKQGQGIIDLVNAYLAVMLNAGVVGLACFMTPFLIVIHRLLGAVRRDERKTVVGGSRFAIAMIAINVAFLFAIFTSSVFGLLSLLLLLMVALPAAWLAMPKEERESAFVPVVEEVGGGMPGGRHGMPVQTFLR